MLPSNDSPADRLQPVDDLTRARAAKNAKLYFNHRGGPVEQAIKEGLIAAANAARQGNKNISTTDIRKLLKGYIDNSLYKSVEDKIGGTEEEAKSFVHMYIDSNAHAGEVDEWLAKPLYQRVAESLIRMDVLRDYDKWGLTWRPRDLIAALLKVYASLDADQLGMSENGPRRKAWVSFALYSLPLAENADLTYFEWASKFAIGSDPLLHDGGIDGKSMRYDSTENLRFQVWVGATPSQYRYSWDGEGDLTLDSALFSRAKLGGKGILGKSSNSPDIGHSQASYFIYPDSPMARVLHGLSAAQVPYSNDGGGPRTLSVLGELCTVLKSRCLNRQRGQYDDDSLFDAFRRMYDNQLSMMGLSQHDSIMAHLTNEKMTSIQCACRMTYIDLYLLTRAWFECISSESDSGTLGKIMKPLVQAFGLEHDGSSMANQMNPQNSEVAGTLGLFKEQAEFVLYCMDSFRSMRVHTEGPLSRLWFGPNYVYGNDVNMIEAAVVILRERLIEAIALADESSDSSLPSLIPYINLPLILPTFATVGGRALLDKGRFALTNELQQGGMMVPEFVHLTRTNGADHDVVVENTRLLVETNRLMGDFMGYLLSAIIENHGAELDKIQSAATLQSVYDSFFKAVFGNFINTEMHQENQRLYKSMRMYPFFPVQDATFTDIKAAFCARLEYSHQSVYILRAAYMFRTATANGVGPLKYCAMEIYQLKKLIEDSGREHTLRSLSLALVAGNMAPLYGGIFTRETKSELTQIIASPHTTVDAFSKYLNVAWMNGSMYKSYIDRQANNAVQRPSVRGKLAVIQGSVDGQVANGVDETALDFKGYVYSVSVQAQIEAIAQLARTVAVSGDPPR